MTIPLKEYQSFVRSKAAPAYATSQKQFDLLHAGLGLATEVLELNLSHSRTNTLEELGDCLWYLTFLSTSLSINPDDLDTDYPNKVDVPLTLHDFTSSSEVMISLIKKHVIYTKEQDLHTQFYHVWLSFIRHLRSCNTDLFYLIGTNMDKLNTRYKSSFTPEESEQRKDKEAFPSSQEKS
jgi:NTP pyrophosphatase (non-canonical NTP hydrolase)